MPKGMSTKEHSIKIMASAARPKIRRVLGCLFACVSHYRDKPEAGVLIGPARTRWAGETFCIGAVDLLEGIAGSTS